MTSRQAIGWRSIDPGSASDFAELRSQRVACGWDEDLVEHQLDNLRAGKIIYWFFILLDTGRSTDRASVDEVERRTNETIIGSAGLDLSGVHNGTSMASVERREFCLSGLFLWQKYV